MKTKAVFYHAGCPVCVAAEQNIAAALIRPIDADPATRPVFAGNKHPRAFAPDDDLRRAVFLSPTTELWV